MIERAGQIRIWALGTLAMAAVLFALLHALGSDGRLTAPGMDSLRVYHYARAMADGRPYAFNDGDATSTGVPGHLQVLLLAIPSALRLDDEWLPTAGFVLALLSHVGLVLVTWLSAARLQPGSEALAAALVLLSGQVLATLYGQTDTGLLTFLAAAGFCAAVHDRYRLLGLLLVFLAFAHPAGVILALTLPVALAVRGPRAPWPGVELLGAAAAGVLGAMAVLSLNFYLGGHPLPMGYGLVLDKSLGTPPQALINALPRTMTDLMEFAFGIGDDQRRAYLVPVIGGAFALWGAIQARGGAWRPGLWWGLAGGLGLVLFSLTGTLDRDLDRSLTWLLPVGMVYAAVGLHAVCLRSPWGGSYAVLAVAMLLFQAASALFHVAQLAESTAATGSNLQFLARVRRNLPASQSVGDIDLPGMKFMLPGPVVRSLEGGVTRDFQVGGFPVQKLEVLRHDADLRFDFWLFLAPNLRGQWFSPLVGVQVDAEQPAFGASRSLALHRADWSTIENTTLPLSPEILALAARGDLVDRLDVGHIPDEKRCLYRLEQPIAHRPLQPYLETLQLGNRIVSDVGRLSYTEERFRVRTEPGRILVLVSRTTGLARVPAMPGQRIPLPWPRELTVHVDGQPAGSLHVRGPDPAQFSEAAMVISAGLITGDFAEFTIRGEHASFGYWIYQFDLPAVRGSESSLSEPPFPA